MLLIASDQGARPATCGRGNSTARSPATGTSVALAQAAADLAIYLAGADPYLDDRLGRLALTKQGLLDRDRMVFAACEQAGVPVAVTMAGGYARDIADTVEIQFNTIETAAWFCGN